MEGCLLCLELNKEFVDCIKVDSTQWMEFNIQNLIEKHLWIMETLLPSSWLCNTCWQALNDFHKFYMRIEEAHMDFGKQMKKETKTHTEENNDLFVNFSLNESYLEPEILIDNLLMEDHKPIIKEEQDDERLDEEDKPLIQRCKRRRHSKDITNVGTTNQDPLNNNKKSKKPSKFKIKKNEPCVQLNPPKDSILNNSEIEKPKMKQDPDTIQMPETSLNIQNSSDSENDDSYTDYDYIPQEKSKPSKKTKKKIKQRRRNCSDSNDSNTDNKPEEDVITRPKQTSKERDQFLTENFKISCVHCQIPMVTFSALVKHFELEHRERGYAVCCNKKFYHRIMLVEHVNRHIDPSNFKCNQCGKELSSRINLKTHQLVHLSEEEKKFTCTECGKTFGEQNKLNIHINQVHLRKYVKICDICGKNVRCGEAFQRHMLEHEGKSLPSISCDVCGLLVSSKHGLRRHKTMQHPVNGKTDYTCNICFKVSPNIYALRKHINSTHKATDSHKCSMCGRGFKRPLALREHMATHTGIALYNCPWCPKTFNASGGMHAHRKTQHPIEWEESRRQKKMEKYKTTAVTEINTVNAANFKVGLTKFGANVNTTDSN